MTSSTMEPEEFHKILRQAASKAKRHRPPWLDTQDLTQAAELALLEAQRKGVTEKVTDPHHLANKTRLRAWGAMMDEIRRAWDGSRKYHQPPAEPMPSDTDGMPLDIDAGVDDQVRIVQMKRAIERFARKGSVRQQEAITLTAAGYSDKEIAVVMGVSESRVSQLKKEARAILSIWGDL